jgi:hypothetical protein
VKIAQFRYFCSNKTIAIVQILACRAARARGLAGYVLVVDQIARVSLLIARYLRGVLWIKFFEHWRSSIGEQPSNLPHIAEPTPMLH